MNKESYAGIAARTHAEEYAWIKTTAEQQLSDELDRVMKINPDWRNMYHEHGRHAACLELMYEQFNIERRQKRRDEEAARDDRREAIANALEQHLEKRERTQKRGCTLSELKTLDANFTGL